MNCISGLGNRYWPLRQLSRYRLAALLGLCLTAACGVETSESADTLVGREYDAHYRLKVQPQTGVVEVSLNIRQPQHLLRELRFKAPADRYVAFDADGALTVRDDLVTWEVPKQGGTLTWRAHIEHVRGKDSYDAWLGPDWGIFRAEDAIPRARTRVLKGATSNTSFTFDLPDGWSAVTEYSGTRDPVRVERSDRRFDQPTGWMVVGDIGVRRDTIAGIRVAVAGPQGQAIRRLDTLALLNWVLPELTELLPEPPNRLTIVTAREPMWRGGLSAPASLFIHADRPMISENATSPLLHEVLHVALPLRAQEESDWIIEGLAEYYGLELLLRGNAISARRHRTAVAEQADWAKKSLGLCGGTSTGPTTALAVTTLYALDQEILKKTGGDSNLDDLLRVLIGKGPMTDLEKLRDAAAEIIGKPSDVLHSDNLPGCPRLAPGGQTG